MLNIKRIFETIADAGQKILEKKSFKSIAKKRDLLDLCDDLLSTKGAAFGITLARDILFRYQNLSVEDKNKFLIEVNEKYKPDPSKIDEAIKRYSDKQDDYSILVSTENHLFHKSETDNDNIFRHRRHYEPVDTS